MTTTLTSSAPSVPAVRVANPTSAATGGGIAQSRLARRWKFGAVELAALAAVILVGAGWALLRWTAADGGVSQATRFTVEPRTFNVVLKEKGELKAAKSTDVICEVEGRSTIIKLIPEGTAVKQGDLLVELASNEIDNRIQQEELKEANAITAYEAAKSELDIQRDKNASDIRKADLEIELKRLELDKYQKGDWEQKAKDAQIAIDQAKISLERRKQDYDAAKELFARSFITQTEYQEDEFNHQKAIWELEKAEKAKEVLATYTHVADLRRRQSDLEEALKEAERTGKNAEAEETKKVRSHEGKQKELALTQEQLGKLRMQKEKCRITAPTQGFVVYYSGGGGRWSMNNDSQVKEGAQVFERQILMQLPDTSAMIIVVRIHEAKTDKLKMGQTVTATIEGIPGRQFTGKVTKIAVVADSQSGWLNPDLKEYETEITLDSSDVPLKPGVTAHAEILVETVEEKLAIPVQSVFTKGGHRYVFRDARGRVQPAEVKIAAIGTEYAEVVEGLSAQDRVLLAFSDEEKRLIPDAAPGGRPEGTIGDHGRGGRPRSAGAPSGAPPAQQPPGSRAGSADSQSGGKPGGGSSESKASIPKVKTP